MAYAEFDITTITTCVINGQTDYWGVLPAAFPPIADLMTTTPTYGENEGVWVCVDTTSPGPYTTWTPVKCESFLKGTRYFQIESQIGGSKVYKAKVRMFYRSVNESYQAGA